jgi:hypothetical protein
VFVIGVGVGVGLGVGVGVGVGVGGNVVLVVVLVEELLVLDYWVLVYIPLRYILGLKITA